MKVKSFDALLQPSKIGVTLIVATIGVVPLFIAVNAGMSITPLAPNPIDGLLFVQL